MKRRILFSLTVFLCLAAGVASASPGQDRTAQGHVIPVLVNVNAKGHVTDVAPAYRISPSLTRLLRDAAGKMITEPAVEDGEPVSCQFVLTFALVPMSQENGTHGVSIKYLSSRALPTGNWFWVHSSSHGLALAGQHEQTAAIPIMDPQVEQREGFE